MRSVYAETAPPKSPADQRYKATVFYDRKSGKLARKKAALQPPLDERQCSVLTVSSSLHSPMLRQKRHVAPKGMCATGSACCSSQVPGFPADSW
jgi:hypothetical protein